MNKLILAFAFFLGFTCFTDAQSVVPPLNSSWQKIRVANRVPVPLPAVQESDIMYSKRVWRYINLRERTNAPLYYPLESTRGRRSLFSVLTDAIRTPRSTTSFGTNTLRVFKDEEFAEPHPDIESFEKSINFEIKVETADQDNPTEPLIEGGTPGGDGGVDIVTVNPVHISAVKIVEDWFFDKKRSQMDSRILALGLVIDERDIHPENKKRYDRKTELTIFWVYYPEARHWLCNQEIYNERNDAGRVSFDDFFLKRKFSSYIYKVENVYNRQISEYTNGLDALLESEKIKLEIFQYEHDLWEY